MNPAAPPVMLMHKGVHATPFAAKILSPPALGRAVMGKKGATIRMIIDAAGVKDLFFCGKDEHFPGTEFQWITIQAMSADSLSLACKLVIEKVEECVNNGLHQGLKHNGHMSISFLIPAPTKDAVQAAAAAIMANTGCEIDVTYESGQVGNVPENVCTIAGLRPNLEQGMELVLLCVQEHNVQEWWPAWTVRPPKGGGKGTAAPPTLANTVPMGGIGQNGAGHFDASLSIAQAQALGALPDLSSFGGAGFGTGLGGAGLPGASLPGLPGLGAGTALPGGLAALTGLPEEPAMAMLQQAAMSLSSQAKQDARGFALCSTLPSSVASRMDAPSQDVAKETSTTVSIGDPSDGFMTLTISGPLLNVCAGYIMLMKCFLEIESGGVALAQQSLAQQSALQQVLQQLQSQQVQGQQLPGQQMPSLASPGQQLPGQQLPGQHFATQPSPVLQPLS